MRGWLWCTSCVPRERSKEGEFCGSGGEGAGGVRRWWCSVAAEKGKVRWGGSSDMELIGGGTGR